MMTDSEILVYTSDMYNGTVFKPWLQSRDKVSIATLRNKCAEWLRVNRSVYENINSKTMTKITYTLITQFLGTDLYLKFSDGARDGEKQNSLIRIMTVTKPTPSVMPPWDEGIAPSINDLSNISKPTWQRHNPISGDYTCDEPTKGNTMNKVFEKKAFVNGRDADGMTDAELLDAIRTCKADITSLESLDVVSKYTLKQIAYNKKAIKKILSILDGRV